MERENLFHLMYLRYVDDVRLILPVLDKGWYWDGENFSFSHERKLLDLEGSDSDEHSDKSYDLSN